MKTRLTPVLLATSLGNCDEDGRLMYVGERLVAVIVMLSDIHAESSGRWFIEATFGVNRSDETFGSADEAAEWILTVGSDRSR
jgi:hypothetical protein